MRAYRFRPRFDSLDQRLLLSDTTSDMGVIPPGYTFPWTPSDEIDPTTLVDWTGDGNPPPAVVDPMNPVVDIPDTPNFSDSTS